MEHDPRALPEGTEIAGYRIVRVLGTGGFGITYEGHSKVTGRRVAIKEFFPRGIASRESSTPLVYASRDAEIVSWALDRFERSASELCRLRHPNIVEVFHYVKANGTGYMIMEYVVGAPLETWLSKRSRPASLDELRPLLDPILDALSYVH